MEIKIKTGEELKRLLDVLGKEIVNANIYWSLFSGLVDSLASHEKEFAQSQTFWGLTLDSLRDASFLHLCRVYDQHEKVLSLTNLLDTIKANLPLFSDVNFRKRLSGNAFVDSLAGRDRIPTIDEVESDIKLVTRENHTVRKLMYWRDNAIAHTAAKISLGKNKILANNPISKTEFKQLLEQSFAICNKYSSLYMASTRSRQITGHDDYKSLLRFIGMGLKK